MVLDQSWAWSSFVHGHRGLWRELELSSYDEAWKDKADVGDQTRAWIRGNPQLQSLRWADRDRLGPVLFDGAFWQAWSRDGGVQRPLRVLKIETNMMHTQTLDMHPASMSVFAAACPRLEQLHVEGRAIRIACATVAALVRALPRLYSLNLHSIVDNWGEEESGAAIDQAIGQRTIFIYLRFPHQTRSWGSGARVRDTKWICR
jgi:hypothetical protein